MRCWTLPWSPAVLRGAGVVIGEMDQTRISLRGGESLLDVFRGLSGLSIEDSRTLLANSGSARVCCGRRFAVSGSGPGRAALFQARARIA